MNKFDRTVVIKEGVSIRLQTKEVKGEIWTFGTICYEDGMTVPFKHVVTKAENFKSYYVWTNETVYIRSHLGTISNIVFDIDSRKQKKIYISPLSRKYAFGNTFKGDNRSLNYDYEIKINKEATLLIDRYWSGSDLCESASIYYSDNNVVNLKPVILCTPADYEISKYYLWDDNYIYTCFDNKNEDIKIESVYDINQRKSINLELDRDKEYMFALSKRNKDSRKK